MRITACLLLAACTPLTSPGRIDVLSAEVQAVRGLKAKERIVVEVLEPRLFNQRWQAAEAEARQGLLGKWALPMLGEAQPANDAVTSLAFYDSHAKKILASRRIEAVANPIVAQGDLVSAIEHALQDQYFDVEKFIKGDSTDEAYARQGLLQADAALTLAAWLDNKPTPQRAPTLGPAPAPHGEAWDPLRESGATAQAALAPIYRSLGWEVVNALFNSPPASTAQLLNATEYTPLHFGSAFWPDHCKQVWTDRLGPGMMSYFTPGAPSDLAWHWLGDQVEVCLAVDDSVQVVWSIEFRHSEDARSALENLRQRFLAGPHRLAETESEYYSPSLDRFEEPAWPIAGTADRNLVVVWSSLPLEQRRVGQELRSLAFAFAPKLATRVELRRQAAAAGDSGDYAACARAFVEVAGVGGDWTDHYHAACCFANAGDSDAAFSELGRLFATRFSTLDTLRKDPDLESLRSQPQWPILLARLSDGQKRYAKLTDPELRALYEEHSTDVARVKAIIANGKAHSADDYYEAAVVLMTSTELADIEAARAWANRAADMDPSFTEANQLTATAEDRRLMLLGQAQKFGSQRIMHNGRLELYPVHPTFTNDERAEWDMLGDGIQ